MRVRTALGCLLLLALAAGACASAVPPYQPSRYDYAVFRARVGLLPEPNYLPWAMHREVLPDGEAALVVCRWPDRAFPLRYHVIPPSIPSELQDEFHPRDRKEYVVAVERAFELWERVLDRPVRFLSVDDPNRASLWIHLDVAIHQEPEGQVMGMLRGEADRCRVVGRGPDRDHVRIEFSVRDAYLFVADRFGLLTPRQVQAIALHEIGHILGASGQHSPLRGDVMYEAADDRRVEKLSEHDRNTFRSLYRVEPGTVYLRLAERHAKPLTEVRRGPPLLDREIVDERFGFEVRFPRGWQVIRSPRGWLAVDGVSWDYDASIQVIALRGSMPAYLQSRALVLQSPDEMVSIERLELDGEPVARIVVRSEGRAEETAVLDWKPGWFLALVADCEDADYTLYQPWFRRVLLSLDHCPIESDAPDR